MATSSNVRVTELDFDTIKTNIKNYLRNQPQFTDFDFDASNMSVLLDILAYNTHYNAVLANMVSNEMFLDTAIKRSSVVSLAKQISYTPRSMRAAQAIVSIAVSNTISTPTYLVLPAFTLFNSIIDGTSYTFYNINAYSTTSIAGTYTFPAVTLYQGRQLSYYYTVQPNPAPTVRYQIPNINVDTTTLQVQIQYGGVGGFSAPWSQVTDITNVTGDSQVFFLQENTSGYYEIFFGDNVIGKNVNAGDVIQILYMVTDGTSANVSTAASVSWSTNTIDGESSANRVITTLSAPSGGASQEDIDTVRFRSLFNYSTQGRAVTKNDYANLIMENLPGAESVNVWGGEDNVPPAYGKTFISIKPYNGYVLTDAEQNNIITNILKPRAMVTTQHEFVDPIYTYVTFVVNIIYDDTQTNLSQDALSQLAYNNVVSFTNTNLNRFNAPFYKSQLEQQIMELDSSILSANVTYDLQKRIPVIPNVAYTAADVIIFPCKIHPNRLRSNYFYYVFPAADGSFHLAQLRDLPNQSPPDYNGTGTLYVIDLDTGEVLNDNVGTVYYPAGKITLDAEAKLTVHAFAGSATEFYANVGVQEDKESGDIFPAYNEVLVLDDTAADPSAGLDNGITIIINPTTK